MTTIYKSEKGKQIFLNLYDQAVAELGVEWEETMVETTEGPSHILIIGPKEAPPLLFLHGGNSINPESLGWFISLSKDYRIYSADLIGHPGKSSQNRPKAGYGPWVGEVIKGLNIPTPISCIGVSYGASVILQAAAHAPELIKQTALVVPGSIVAPPKLKLIFQLLLPLLLYKIFGGTKRLLRTITPIAISPSNLSISIMEAAFNHLKMASLLPVQKIGSLRTFNASVLIIGADKDVFFLPKACSLVVLNYFPIWLV
ncbi:alpha/beta hydrolase [Aureispira]|nr:alpha/beta hydrolase [Aureispira sp.]